MRKKIRQYNVIRTGVYSHRTVHSIIIIIVFRKTPRDDPARCIAPTDNRYSHYYTVVVKYVSSIIIYACALGCPRSCARKCIIYIMMTIIMHSPCGRQISRFGGNTAAAVSIYYSGKRTESSPAKTQ